MQFTKQFSSVTIKKTIYASIFVKEKLYFSFSKKDISDMYIPSTSITKHSVYPISKMLAVC